LAAVFAFAGVLNAFAMTGPVFTIESWIAGATGVRHELPILLLLFVLGLGALPLGAVLAAAAATRALRRTAAPLRVVASRYVWTLVPVGLGIWIAHYAFHFLTGIFTVFPVAQSAARDLFGWSLLGAPRWTWVGLPAGAVYPIEIGFLLLGVAGSAAVATDVAQRESPDRVGPAAAPWAALALVLGFAAGWVLSLPMEMRGTVL
jgi:hypothetical protein